MKKIYFVSLDTIEIYLNKIGKSWRGFRFEKDLSDDVVREIADKVMSVEDFCQVLMTIIVVLYKTKKFGSLKKKYYLCSTKQ